MNSTDPLSVAVEYLLARRRGGGAAETAELELARLGEADLRRALSHDAARLAFWIDVYNGAVLRHHIRPDRLHAERWRYFRRTAVVVAGKPLSLDAIEHGILRRSRWKLGLGFLAHPWPGRFERTHRVERVDPRIHFALNCGVASCPPIAAYTAELIDGQLDLATRSHLATEVEHDGALMLPALMLWYAGDFGGATGMRRFLRGHEVDGWNGPIRFKRYDWTPAPDRWASDETGA